MLVDFFSTLRRFDLPCSLKEYLSLLDALDHDLAFADIDEFYRLARVCLIKDERYFDTYDRAFSAYFEGLAEMDVELTALIPDEWLTQKFLNSLSDEEKSQLESLGSLEKLLDTLRERLAEQTEEHHGGNKWVGTGGTSPFGHGGYHPEGIRIGGKGEHQRAVKVWEKREFSNYADDIELGTRNIKMALRRLRKFARDGATDELDLPDTIRSTAHQGGILDIRMVPERHNAAKVLLFLDVGGSMDPYVSTCEELFSAARSEFKHLEYYYFHNFVYEHLWRDNSRRYNDTTSTLEVLRTYPADYRVVFVGDARMSPYEIASVGGSVEHMNQEPGAAWMQRFCRAWEKLVWLNPTAEEYWDRSQSTEMIRELIDDRMYPLTLAGIEEAMRYLGR